MARTQQTGTQIADGSISRNDLDVTTIGSSVVRRLIAGTNISFSSTGADTGTGDVTINASGGSNITKGTVTIDFGTEGADTKTVTVSTASVTTGSVIVVTPNPAGTADHSADEHILESFKLGYNNIINGVSFDITMISTWNGNLYKTWSVNWALL